MASRNWSAGLCRVHGETRARGHGGGAGCIQRGWGWLGAKGAGVGAGCTGAGATGCGAGGLAWRRDIPVECFESLFVHRGLFGRDGFDDHLGVNFANGVGKRIEVSEILALLDCVNGVNDQRHLEDILGNPGERRNEQDVEQKRP